MHYISGTISSWLCKQGAIVEEDRELYEYAAYCFLITISPLIMALVYSAIIGEVMRYAALLLPFMCLRQYCGGYHAKKAWICMLSSFLTLVLMIHVAVADSGGVLHWVLLGLACISIIKNSPIDSENRRLDEQEKLVYHTKAVQILLVFLFLIAVLTIFALDTVGNAVGIGIILVAISQVPCIAGRYMFKEKAE